MANKIIISGRLVKDAELSYIPNTGTPKMVYTLAVERGYQKDKNNKKVDFINCEAIGKHCENLCQYVTKGKLVLVEGELNIDSYDKDGETRKYTKVKVDRLEFLAGTKKDDAAATGENNQTFTPSYEPPKGLDPNGFQVIDDDEIPF